MQTALQDRIIRQNIAADRKAAARRVLADMVRKPTDWLVNGWVPGIALVQPANPHNIPRRPLPLRHLTVEAARGGLRHLRLTSRGMTVDHARQAMQLAAVVFAMRMRAAPMLRKAA